MKFSISEKVEVRSLFMRAIDSLSCEYKGSSLTDIFVLIDAESGELLIYDDEGHCIVKDVVDSWTNYNSEDSHVHVLRTVLEEINLENGFQSLNVFTPFSISLVDENFEVREELLVIDDESTVRIEADFLDRLDKDFDLFLEKLLKD